MVATHALSDERRQMEGWGRETETERQTDMQRQRQRDRQKD